MVEKYFYSKKNNCFYPGTLREAYESSVQGWPDDCIAISSVVYEEMLTGQSSGKIISANENGMPELIEPLVNWRERAEAQRQTLLFHANNKVIDWRTELQLGIISEGDRESLLNWVVYIKSLKDLDLANVNDGLGYDAISWPINPEHS